MDWRFVLFIFNVMQFAVGLVIFCVIKFNDIRHIDANLMKVDEKVDALQNTVSCLAKEVGTISGYIQGQKDK